MKQAVLVLVGVAVAAVLGGSSGARAGAVSIRPVCGAVPVGHARCFSYTNGNAAPLLPAASSLRAAYPRSARARSPVWSGSVRHTDAACNAPSQ